jgi:hypothetical protein
MLPPLTVAAMTDKSAEAAIDVHELVGAEVCTHVWLRAIPVPVNIIVTTRHSEFLANGVAFMGL